VEAHFIEAYRNREIDFRFRGRDYAFSLSHGLFSSAGIDIGSRLLLKVFSGFLDTLSCGEAPYAVLDAGSGAGVLGICAAGGLLDLGAAVRVRAQDRDELARLFTEFNAERNGLSQTEGSEFSAHTEPLLAGPAAWDIILSNIPAKAGLPVLEDFVSRSAGLLKKNGLVFLVTVNTLAGFFRDRIRESAIFRLEQSGKEHTVFVFGAGNVADKTAAPLVLDENFPQSYPFYIRNQNEYEMENIAYRLDTVHGAPDFDSPGGEVRAAAKLTLKIRARLILSGESRFLIYGEGQGHFALWLVHYFAKPRFPLLLSGRNIVALASARAALRGVLSRDVPIVPSADIYFDGEALVSAAAASAGQEFRLIAFFPEIVPETDWEERAWEGLLRLTAPGGIVIASMSSAGSERFNRKKPAGLSGLGDIRRNGFRALAYQRPPG
jgi:hypothetical protein